MLTLYDTIMITVMIIYTVSYCADSPCQNNAQCNEVPGDFTCDCPAFSGGKRCEYSNYLP